MTTVNIAPEDKREIAILVRQEFMEMGEITRSQCICGADYQADKGFCLCYEKTGKWHWACTAGCGMDTLQVFLNEGVE